MTHGHKSGRQRREEIRARRLARAERLHARAQASDPRGLDARDDAWVGMADGPGVEPVDPVRLRALNPFASALPTTYLDRRFLCRDCGEAQVWTAKQQKWWYEVAGGRIETTAVRCLPCRRARQSLHAGPDPLRSAVARLRVLATEPPSPSGDAEIEQALTNKWWSVRNAAIATLGAWGRPADVARLKAWVDAAATARWGSWEAEAGTVAGKVLSHALPATELDWAWAYALQTAYAGGAWDVWFESQTIDAIWPKIAAEIAHGDTVRLCRALWFVRRLPFRRDQRAWLVGQLEAHPAHAVRRMLQALLAGGTE